MNVKQNEHIQALSSLFKEHFKAEPSSINVLPKSGSNRVYFRILGENESFIGAYNADVKENQAFFAITKHFASKDINVPTLLAESANQQYYLISDLGDSTLYSMLSCYLFESDYNEKMMSYFKSSLEQLVKIQTKGNEGFDYSVCYPKQVFDHRSVMWDFNYFKYSFLKPVGAIFDEEKLEDDFESFANYLLNDDMSFFQYRDFQSRNVMVKDEELYFIDYQGGRRGPCLYDVASFIYQAKAAIPQNQREILFEHYIDALSKERQIDKKLLKERFPAFVLFRVIQTLGAYGYRGYFEGKTHFIQSIPPAIKNLDQLLYDDFSNIKIKYLVELLKDVIKVVELKYGQVPDFKGLTIDISSFSLKNGYPNVNPEHGGGFIFDCRSLQNPGRLLKFKTLTGLDKPVADYLNEREEVDIFMSRAFELVFTAANNYIERGFKYLSVGFGCTGGQHRSVYCADRLAKMLDCLQNVKINVSHKEIG